MGCSGGAVCWHVERDEPLKTVGGRRGRMVREESARACPAGGAGVPTPFKVWAQARFGHGVQRRCGVLARRAG
jgi:hypothetical protein